MLLTVRCYKCANLILRLLSTDICFIAIPVHCTNGTWGTIAVGLFASRNRLKMAYGETNDIGVFMGGNGTLLGCQVVGILFIVGWVTLVMIPFFYMLNYLGWLRAESIDEIEGLDSRYHKRERRPSAEFVHALSVYGHGNERLRQNISNFEEGKQQELQNVSNFNPVSEILSSEENDRRRSTVTFDSFEDHGVTPQRKQYEQRFTADSGSGLVR
jgi:hypothetical protein